VAVAVAGQVKSPAVIAQLQREPLIIPDTEINFRRRASGVADRVVYRLFEYQKDFTPQICVQTEVAVRSLKPKRKIDAPSAEDITRKPAHALGEISQVVPFGINRPHNVAHRINQFARETSDG